MPAIEWSSHFAKLFLEFLSSAPAVSGIPDLTALPKKKQDDTAKLKRPRIVVSCEKQDSAHPKIWRGVVTITHAITITQDGNEPTEAAAVNAAIEAWLNDAAAWAAFIQAKPVAERTGWMLTRKVPGHWESDSDTEAKTRDYALPVELTAVVAPAN